MSNFLNRNMVFRRYFLSRIWSLLFVTIVLFLLISKCRKCTWRETKLYNLMAEIYGDSWFIEVADQNNSGCTIEYANANRLQQNHPCVIELIRSRYLHQPPSENVPLNLTEPEIIDPSGGNQSKLILGYLKNQVLFDANDVAGKIYLPFTYLKSKPTIEKEEIIYGLIEAQCFPLYSILLAVGRTQIEYLSLDVEGSEYPILMNVPWHLVDIKTLTVEITSRSGEDMDLLTSYMEKNGYKMVKLMDGPGFFDVVFVKRDLI